MRIPAVILSALAVASAVGAVSAAEARPPVHRVVVVKRHVVRHPVHRVVHRKVVVRKVVVRH